MSDSSIRFDLASTLHPYPLKEFPLDLPPELAEWALDDSIDPEWIFQVIERNLGRDLRVYGDFVIDRENPMVQRARRMITPTASLESAHAMIREWRGDTGIVRATPDLEDLYVYDDVATDVPLLNGFQLDMDALLQQDRAATLVLSSPNGISGRAHLPLAISRLARHFSMVVIDERYAGFNLRRLTPMINEWSNIVAVERLPFIMPGQTTSLGWLTHVGELSEEIGERAKSPGNQAMLELNRYWWHDRGLAERHVARLKGQLYRELRKLSVVSVPYPSWSNFMLAKVERGDRDEIVAELADRGIAVYAPPHANLRQHLRVTAVSREATAALKDALIEINRGI